MHAASVNPEPGSNSLKNCIISYQSAGYNLFRVFSDYLLLLCWVFSKSAFSVSQENINEILSHLHVLKNFLCCSIFKEQVPRPRCSLEVGLSIIAKVFSFVNPFLKKSLVFLKISFFATRTRWKGYGIIPKLSRKKGAARNGHWKLNNKRKVQSIASAKYWSRQSLLRILLKQK